MTNADSCRKWRKANPEKVRKLRKAWRTANLEKARAIGRAWYAANRENARKAKQNWRKRNHSATLAHLAVQSALTRGLIIKKPCAKCGSKSAEAHHPDYSKRLKVTWLCSLHHKQQHKKEK